MNIPVSSRIRLSFGYVLLTVWLPCLATGQISDSTAPELKALSLAPLAVDISAGEAVVNATITAQDDLSGVDYVQLRLTSPDGNISRFGSLSAQGQISATGTVTLNVPRFSQQGVWILSLFIEDQAGNDLSLSAGQLAAAGFPTQVTVTGISDTKAPDIKGLVLSPTTVNASFGEAIVNAAITVQDDLSGVKYVQLRLTSPDGKISIFGSLSGQGQLSASGTTTLNVPRFSQQGVWILSLFVEDQAGNDLSLSAGQLAAAGFPTQVTVTGLSDSNAPEITSLVLSPTTVSASAGEASVNATITAQDNLSGVDYVQLRLTSPDGKVYVLGLLSAQGALSASGTAIIKLPQFSQQGVWTLSLYLEDVAGNTRTLSAGQLTAAGFPTQVMVAPPSVTLSVSPTQLSFSYQSGSAMPLPQILQVSTNSNVQFGASAAGGSWISLTFGGGSAPDSLTVSVNPMGLAPGTYNGTISITAASASNNPVTIPVSLTVLNASAACFFYGNTGISAPAVASSGTFALGASASACSWTAASSASWVQVYPLSGTGTSQISYVVYPNFSTRSRLATITAGGQTFTILQVPGVGSPDERFVGQIYFNFFGRVADPSEVAFQVREGLQRGIARPDFVMNFFGSQEFNQAGRFVAGLYIGFLNRDAEYGGWLFQRNALAMGQVNQNSLVTNFMNSDEYRLNFGTPDNAAFVSLLYRYILLREPSINEIGSQAAVLASGVPRVVMASAFLNSAEFRNGTGARLTAFLLYGVLLNRDPTPSELELRISQLKANISVSTLVAQILSSAEFASLLQ